MTFVNQLSVRLIEKAKSKYRKHHQERNIIHESIGGRKFYVRRARTDRRDSQNGGRLARAGAGKS